MSDVREKIDGIRQALGDLTGDQKEEIARWDKALKSHELYSNWAKHPVTKEVFAKLAMDLAGFNKRLSTEEELPEVERKAIFMVKAAFLWMLTLPRSHAKAIETIERDVDAAVEEVVEYQKEPGFGRK